MLRVSQNGSVFDNESKLLIFKIPAFTITTSSFAGSFSHFSTFVITASVAMSKPSDLWVNINYLKFHDLTYDNE